jgi:uncharacterized protein YfiM (DUF2279 family)
VGSLGLCFVLLLLGPAWLAAQDSAGRLFPGSVNSGSPPTSETASSTRSFPVYRLLPQESRDHESWSATPAEALSLLNTEPAVWTQPRPTHWLLLADSSECARCMAAADPTIDAPPLLEQADAELPRWEFLERHRLLFSTLIPITELALVTANSLIGYDTDHGFQVTHEGWFGPNTVNGGADKASHLTDYFVVASVGQDVYRILGYSENAAILWGFGLALATGLGNEVSDGFTRHGLSWEDFAMDAAGATTASVLTATHTRDLLGLRTSHLPNDTYTHDVYSLDFKISGLGRRLGVNIGPLRWLLLSVTYGTKGYRIQPPIELQRQVGFEIGLNLEQILNDVGVKRNTWWGYSLHLFGDYVRFPFTAVGMRYDLNHGKWHGPNAGNYD